MNRRARQFWNSIRHGLAVIAMGPQGVAFISAVILAAYWVGGEAAMVFLALGVPALFALSSIFTGAASMRARDLETGLPLRAHAEDALTRIFAAESQTGKSCAALAFEIDAFDDVQSQLGEASAQTLLTKIAARVQGAIRDCDMLVSLEGPRFGLAVGPSLRLDLETLIRIASRIQAEIAEPVSINAARVFVTASAGFCLPGRAPSRNGAAILSAAEAALAEARLNGPGSIRAFSPDLQRRLSERQSLSAEVVTALDQDQIRPWFMPQVSTHTGRIVGFDTQPRWEHPSRGNIIAGDFAELVRRQDLGERLGEVMLSGALKALATWDKSGLNIPSVTVRISGARLSDPQLVDKIAWELDRWALEPARLFIEIAEDVIAAGHDDVVSDNITRLADMGCRIDLDDFGTGHASIANIRRFSVNRIKIDKSFVTRVDRDIEQQNMVAAVLTMSERLSLDTVAEGVETAAEHTMLAQLGCNAVQGHSVSRPMDFDSTIAWIEAHNARLPTDNPIAGTSRSGK